MRRRGLLLTAVIAAVVLAAGGGWLAGRNIKSPAELAAEAAPPEPSRITVAVELTELSSDVITRADVGYDEPAAISLAGALGGRPAVLVVTSLPDEGAELSEGTLAVEVSGRPVLLLQGEIPMFRDLRPGAEGVDVLQLEQALLRLGFFQGEPDQAWDEQTGQAVAAWYEAAGYRPNALTDDEEAALDAARARVRAAVDALGAAQEGLDEAGQGPSATELLTAQSAVTSAEEQLRLAQIEADRAASAADEAVRTAEFERDRAARAYTSAQARWQSALAGVHPDTGTTPTPVELEQLRLELDVAGEALRVADKRIVDARISRDVQAVQSASSLRSAEDQVTLSRARLDELTGPPDTASLDRSVAAARQELADARRELADLQAATGIWVPAGELVFLKRLPVRVDSLAVSRGGRADGALLTVTGSNLAVRGSVSTRDVGLVKEGAAVRIEDPSVPEPIAGTVRLVESRAGTRGVGPDRHYVEIVAEGIPAELIGTNVKVVIPVSSTAGEVLAVPAAALSATADGSTRVEVEAPDGTTRFVTVEPGLSADGLVEVKPLDGPLAAGDRVVIGFAVSD